jgi:hypothetical protein
MDKLWKTGGKKHMSTALVYCGTPEGFVIGADGRAFDMKEQRVHSDTERKIFGFENQDASIVFAWAGTVKVHSDCFDISFVKETYELLSRADFSGFFAQDLSTKLKEKLRFLGTRDIGEAAKGLFLSYRKGRPWMSFISVFMNGLTWDCFAGEDMPDGRIEILAGPKKDFKKPESLAEATSLIDAYLTDCVQHPTNYIGGHVHIGQLTPDGFSWVRPPKE